MRFPQALHAEGWHTHLHRLRPTAPRDELPSLRERRGVRVLAVTLAACGLLASVSLAAANDPRPLDEQLHLALHRASDLLQQWHGQLAHGLQVSWRAVADGQDPPPQASALQPAATAPDWVAAWDDDDSHDAPAPRRDR